jgi:uncharacterized membrane protein (DUF485 family)
MHKTPEAEPQASQHNLPKKRNKRIWIFTLIFFAFLFGSVIVIPLSGFHTTAAIIVIAFGASILYVYLF